MVFKAKNQALAGDHDVLYRDLTQYGFNINTQMFQSASLDFPYVYWHSGDYDMHDYPDALLRKCGASRQNLNSNYDFSVLAFEIRLD
ncbi:MAG: minor structural protein (endogenous virus) [Lactobacillus phage ViSo-2018b]|nr:MAG: minor structural protein [Lactobacillus phage ViSo-2018b]